MILPGSRSQTWTRLAACAVVAGFLLISASGCSADDRPSRQQSSKVLVAPLDPPAPQNAAGAYVGALAALNGAVRIANAAYRKGDGDASGLQAVASGPALNRLEVTVRTYSRKGYTARGDFTFTPTTHTVDDYADSGVLVRYGEVVITGCADYSRFDLRTGSGSRAPRSGPLRTAVAYHVTWQTFSWKLSDAGVTGRDC